MLLNGGGAPAAYSPGGKSLGEAPPGNLTPAVWARGSGGWLGRDDSASTSAYGRTYNYNLDRDLQTMDFQVGLDFGKRDVLSQGDALVFGMLGGFVQANLDYDNLVRQFDFSGGQVGAYATYLKGGLFVDTLFNAHLYALDPTPRSASRIPSTPRRWACAPTPATASAASRAAPSSSRWPRSR